MDSTSEKSFVSSTEFPRVDPDLRICPGRNTSTGWRPNDDPSPYERRDLRSDEPTGILSLELLLLSAEAFYSSGGLRGCPLGG